MFLSSGAQGVAMVQGDASLRSNRIAKSFLISISDSALEVEVLLDSADNVRSIAVHMLGCLVPDRKSVYLVHLRGDVP